MPDFSYINKLRTKLTCIDKNQSDNKAFDIQIVLDRTQKEQITVSLDLNIEEVNNHYKNNNYCDIHMRKYFHYSNYIYETYKSLVFCNYNISYPSSIKFIQSKCLNFFWI